MNPSQPLVFWIIIAATLFIAGALGAVIAAHEESKEPKYHVYEECEWIDSQRMKCGPPIVEPVDPR